VARRRPNPALWLYYQFTGVLPASYREWVLHDATCRSWFLRVVLRALIQAAPVLGLLVFVLRGLLGGPWLLVLGSLLLGLLVYLRIALTVAMDSLDSRLLRYGYPPGHATAVRRQSRR